MGLHRWTFGGADVLLATPGGWGRKLRTLGGLLGPRAPAEGERPPVTEGDPVPHDGTPEGARLADRVRGRGWYHTIELPHGVVTPGGFDHRPYLAQFPIPARLDGLRVLDVATFDGFWAFELERRGAAEVVAIDVPNLAACDLSPAVRKATAPADLAREMGERFAICHEALGSKVRREALSVYDLSPERLGRFDLVHAGALLLHLMNPMKALQHICSVTGGKALLIDIFHPALPGKLMSYESGAVNCTWWLPGLGALQQMIEDAGFSRVELKSRFPVGYRGQAPSLWHAAFEAWP